MSNQITERDAMQMAVDSNYMYYGGGYELEVERRPSENCATRLMCQQGTENFVFPSDLYIITAVWYCGVATTYSVAAILHKMRNENPEKAILDTSVSDEKTNKKVATRLKKLEKTGIFYRRRVIDTTKGRSIVTYTVSPEAVRLAFQMLEIPVNYSNNTIGFWGERREFLRQLMVSRWIAYNMEVQTIKHFRRNRRIPKQGQNQHGTHEYNYLWLSTEKNGIKYSVVVQPFIFTNDEVLTNEHEHKLITEEIPFQKLNDHMEYCKKGEYTGGLILIVDKESDLGLLAQSVKSHLPEEYFDRILLTSNGLIGTQTIDSMYFGVNGQFVPPDKRFI